MFWEEKFVLGVISTKNYDSICLNMQIRTLLSVLYVLYTITSMFCQSWPKFGYQALTMTWESLETWELENLLKLEKIIFRNEISPVITSWNFETVTPTVLSSFQIWINIKTNNQVNFEAENCLNCQLYKNLKNCKLLPHSGSKNASEMTKIFMSYKNGIRWIKLSSYTLLLWENYFNSRFFKTWK